MRRRGSGEAHDVWRWSMWGADARRGARRIRRAIPPRRGLRGGDHDDAGDCLRVQDRTAALRLSSVYGCAVMPFTTR
jgi:hypothetical protein